MAREIFRRRGIATATPLDSPVLWVLWRIYAVARLAALRDDVWTEQLGSSAPGAANWVRHAKSRQKARSRTYVEFRADCDGSARPRGRSPEPPGLRLEYQFQPPLHSPRAKKERRDRRPEAPRNLRFARVRGW